MPRRPTLIETLLHDALRAFEHFGPRTEVWIGRYRVDVLVGHVVLEADGPWHCPERDGRRDRYLRERGFVVVHLPEAEILALSPLGLIDRLDHILRENEAFSALPCRRY